MELKEILKDFKSSIKGPLGISDFFFLDKKIKKINRDEIKACIKIKIAVLTSFTTRGLVESLNVICAEHGVLAEFYVAPYNQCFQQILDTHSPLYVFEPDLTFVFVDIMSLLGEEYFFPYKMKTSERKHFVEEKSGEIKNLLEVLNSDISGKVVVHNFQVPVYSPRGIVEYKEDFGFIEMVQTLNCDLRDFLKKNKKAYLFDYDSFCARHGKDFIFDQKMYYLADIKLDLEKMPSLSEYYLEYIIPLCALTKKCLVLDLDNTLWGGVIGEDGIEGIKLGPEKEGKPFFELQKAILNLYDRGIILAVNSKNNLQDALNVLQKHPYMLLKEKHFASMQINWMDKATNMIEIANEINIGLDSLVFLDDDHLNRELIRDKAPEVYVIDFPKDPALLPNTMENISKLFSTLEITSEDLKKGEMYVSQRKRRELKSTVNNIDDFLKSLEMKLTIEEANTFNTPRISQMTQKTNQFNLTTKRYMEEEIAKFSESNDYLVQCVKVQDKFGDNGITGCLIIIKESSDVWSVDTFLLSCRILGRRIEAVFLAKLIERAKSEGVRSILGEFIPTDKNMPASNFYKDMKFELLEKKNDGSQRWSLNIQDRTIEYPEFIEIISH